jgi:hypothetical protein
MRCEVLTAVTMKNLLFTLNMKAVRSSEVSVNQTKRRHVLDDSILPRRI